MSDNDNNKSKISSEFEEKSLSAFLSKYGGAVLGGIIAILLWSTQLYKLLIGLILILVGMFVGNYIQKNKTNVKEKLKEFIDKF